MLLELFSGCQIVKKNRLSRLFNHFCSAKGLLINIYKLKAWACIGLHVLHLIHDTNTHRAHYLNLAIKVKKLICVYV